MKDFVKLIRNATDAIEGAADYLIYNKNMLDYLKDHYVVDDETDLKQYVMKYIEDYFWNE